MMRKNNRGFSLVEVVVAMAVILIISAAVLSMMLSASRAGARATAHHLANTHLADIITVYRVSTPQNFEANLAFALGLESIDLLAVPLAEGYTAELGFNDGTLTITVTNPKAKQTEYAFTNPSWEVSQ